MSKCFETVCQVHINQLFHWLQKQGSENQTENTPSLLTSTACTSIASPTKCPRWLQRSSCSPWKSEMPPKVCAGRNPSENFCRILNRRCCQCIGPRRKSLSNHHIRIFMFVSLWPQQREPAWTLMPMLTTTNSRKWSTNSQPPWLKSNTNRFVYML